MQALVKMSLWVLATKECLGRETTTVAGSDGMTCPGVWDTGGPHQKRHSMQSVGANISLFPLLAAVDLECIWTGLVVLCLIIKSHLQH